MENKFRGKKEVIKLMSMLDVIVQFNIEEINDNMKIHAQNLNFFTL